MVRGDILAQLRQNMRQQQAVGRAVIGFDAQGRDHGGIRPSGMPCRVRVYFGDNTVPIPAGHAKSKAAPGQEQCNFVDVELLCKDLPANPCREIVAGGLSPAVKRQSQA
jgi:hypothetical protein